MVRASRHDGPATVRGEKGFDPVQGLMTAQWSAECVLYLDNGHKPERTVNMPCVQSPLSGEAVTGSGPPQ
jgi:hypothetical protein